MPNHIKNVITIKGTPEEVEQVIEKYSTAFDAKIDRSFEGEIICRNTKEEDYSVGWFNERTGVFTRINEDPVVGLPDGWEFEIKNPYLCFPDFEKVIPQPENIFKGDLSLVGERECKELGIPTWYDWNLENWGTKWNSYSCTKESWNTFSFSTAWSSVPNIVGKISESFPDIEFEYKFADENTGYNCGAMIFKNGLSISEYFPEEGSKEAYEFAFELKPEDREYYELKDGKYNICL